MNQITDSLAAPSGGRAKAGGKPQQADGAATDAATGPAPRTGAEQGAPDKGRKPGTPAFADILQGDAAVVQAPPTDAPLPRGAGGAGPAAPAAGFGRALPQGMPAQGVPVQVDPDPRAAGATASGTDIPRPATPPAAPDDAPGRAVATRAVRPAQQQAAVPAQPQMAGPAKPAVPAGPAEPGAAAGTDSATAEARAEPGRPVPIQRARPDIGRGMPPELRAAGLPLEGKPANPTEVKAAARDFADQMTRGSARMTPDAPMHTIAAPRGMTAAPPAVATAPEAVTPGAESLGDAAPDPLPNMLGTDRQALVITPARAAPVAAAPLLHGQAATQPAATPDSILAQISTHLSSSGRSEMTLQLDPPELGLVRIGLTMGEGNVTAVITADRADIDGMLRRHAAQLQTALEDAGYHGVDLSFGEHGQGMGDGDGSDRQTAPSAFVRLGATDQPSTASAAGTWLAGDGLDLRL